MKKEYLSVQRNYADDNEFVDNMSTEGWELVTIVPMHYNDCYIYWFKLNLIN